MTQSLTRRRPIAAPRLAAAFRCRTFVRVAFLTAGLTLGSSAARCEDDVVIVVGVGGTEEYATQFAQWAERWQAVATTAAANITLVGPPPKESPAAKSKTSEPETSEPDDREKLLESLGRLKAVDSKSPLWLVLIGHGTYQQGEAKFNLRGRDVSAGEFAKALEGATRPLVIVNTASASGPFLAALSSENRVVVTATRSGDEQNFARFGDYLSRAVSDLSTDLDHDARVSILEAFLAAAYQTRQFYEREGRLATEHALIDDNGDSKGTSSDFFRGIRVVRKSEGEGQPDGPFAAGISLSSTPEELALPPEQRERIAQIEQSVRDLRARKSELESDEYYAELERLMIEMAKLYERSGAPDS